MARIFQEGNDFFLFTRDGEKKLAFSSPLKGHELRSALYHEEVDVLLNGWSFYDIEEDLLESGILAQSVPSVEIAPKVDPDFFVIEENKGSVVWAHKSGVAKKFHTRSLENSTYFKVDSNDDVFERSLGPTGRVHYSGVTMEDAEKDFLSNSKEWREYTKVYDPNFRKCFVKF